MKTNLKIFAVFVHSLSSILALGVNSEGVLRPFARACTQSEIQVQSLKTFRFCSNEQVEIVGLSPPNDAFVSAYTMTGRIAHRGINHLLVENGDWFPVFNSLNSRQDRHEKSTILILRKIHHKTLNELAWRRATSLRGGGYGGGSRTIQLAM
jgi:hypothetical protein